jgi:pyruvate decarboxylase
MASQAQSSTQMVANLQAEISRLKHELQTMKVDEEIPSAGETCTIADYLLERLVQLKVTVRTPISFMRIHLCLKMR